MRHPNRQIGRRDFLRLGALAGAMACAGCGSEGEGSVQVGETKAATGGKRRLDMLRTAPAAKGRSDAPAAKGQPDAPAPR